MLISLIWISGSKRKGGEIPPDWRCEMDELLKAQLMAVRRAVDNELQAIEQELALGGQIYSDEKELRAAAAILFKLTNM